MLLVILVALGVAIFGFIKGYYFVVVFSLMGMLKGFGFVGFILSSLYLFYKGDWIVGLIPIVLIAWNLIGLNYLNKMFNKDQ